MIDMGMQMKAMAFELTFFKNNFCGVNKIIFSVYIFGDKTAGD